MKKIILYISIFIFIVVLIGTIVFINQPIKNKIVEKDVYEVFGEKISKKSSYNNPIIPEGFKKVETETASWELEEGIPKGWNSGLVIEDENGNQFVWIPYEVDRNLSGYKVVSDIVRGPIGCENEREFLQIVNYGGFYISRYEAGLPEKIQQSVKEFNVESNNVEGIPVSKKDKIVWNFIEWNMAKKNAKLMYNRNNIKSDLITQEQWETVVRWLTSYQEIDTKNSVNYGNFSNANFTFTGYYSTDYGNTYKYAKNKQKAIENMLLSTGASERNKNNNIYDLAGNVFEFLDVSKTIQDNAVEEWYLCVGGYYDSVGTYSISHFQSVGKPNSKQGFRIVLYLE